MSVPERPAGGWALPLLRCLECAGTGLESGLEEVRCPSCGTTYPWRDDVGDFLYRPHPAIVRELEAVRTIDREDGVPREKMRAVLDRLERDALTSKDLAGSAHIRAIAESREQILELLEREPIAPGSRVLELGADVGWATSILLDAECRVVAIDITDHLHQVRNADDPDLCRLLADMNRVPLADATMDVVFAASCAHHSWDLGLTFREIARILKPGGTAYLCGEPLPSLPRYVVGGGFGRRERELGINETWIRRADWLHLCRQAGLEPRIVFPALSDAQVRERLRRKHLPGFLAGLLRLAMPVLQVSAHLRADKKTV